MTVWDPAVYERYKTYRDRPALDLMLRIPQDLEPQEIWDLGCGTGEHAAVLKRRHPGARVHGLDSSPDMLAEARARREQVDWRQGDISGFAPDAAPDLIFTNAALHWLPAHEVLFPRLVATLAEGGVFACQMPVSFDAPWHVVLRETAADGPWAGRLEEVRGVRQVQRAEVYFDWLRPHVAEIDLWTTTYLHELEGPDPVVDWMKGTGLRPFLQALASGEEREVFLDAYRARLLEIFPPRADGKTLLPFPRLFIVSRR
jgi:trans-aconitate 2-methyltransferase